MKQFLRSPLLLTSLLGSSLLLTPGKALAQCKLYYDLVGTWQVAFQDDFLGTQFDNTVWADTPPYGIPVFGWGSEWYPSGNASLPYRYVSGGQAHLRATQWVNAQGQPQSLTYQYDPTDPSRTHTARYTSGMLVGRRGGILHTMQGYGAWEASIKISSSLDAWPTFWLWSGLTEIDIIDGVSFDKNASQGLLNNVIKNETTADPTRKACEQRFQQWSPASEAYATLLAQDYHVYSMVWTPEQVTFFLDGRELRTVPKSSVVADGNAEHDLFINLQVQPWTTGPLDITMDVDWVRILKPKTGTYSVAASTYKSSSELINHDISYLGIAPEGIDRAANNGPANVSSVAGAIAVNSQPVNPSASEEVFYRGTDNKLYVASQTTPANWDVQALPSANSSWQVGGDVLYNPSLNWAVYTSQARTVQGYYFNRTSGSWQHTAITSSSDAAVHTDPASLATHLSDPTVVYRGTDNLLHCYTWSTPGVLGVLTTLPNTDPNPAAAAVAGDVLLEQHSPTIYYRGGDSRVQCYYLDGATYRHTWIDDDFGNPATQILNQPRSLTSHDNILYYIGKTDGKIHRLAYNGATNHFDHSLLYNGPELAKGDIYCNPEGNRITYLGTDGRLQGLYLEVSNNAWYHYWLDDYWITGEYLSFTGAGSASIVSTGNLRAFYCGQDNHLRYFNWEPCEFIAPNCSRSTLHRSSTATPLAATPATAVEAAPVAFPNPTTGLVKIELPTRETVEFTVYSSLGRVVHQGSWRTGTGSLDLSAYPPGVYLLLAHSAAGEAYRLKLTKE